MEIRVRVLNSNNKENKKEDKKGDEFRESLKVLTPQYVRQLNKDVSARLRQIESRHQECIKDIEEGFMR